uniref:Reverse transcriptase domain-containing protein n=1 Tax=Gongylonema pulchrum TaxID=637853 RepID=A0A183D356_9BILA
MIEWKFIGTLAPWKGGIYERLRGIIKNSLVAQLVDEKLVTQSCKHEVEGTINEHCHQAIQGYLATD